MNQTLESPKLGSSLPISELAKILQSAGGRVIEDRAVPELCRDLSYGHTVLISVPNRNGVHRQVRGNYSIDLELIWDELMDSSGSSGEKVSKTMWAIRQNRMMICNKRALESAMAEVGLI